jgi:hypothetical protein
MAVFSAISGLIAQQGAQAGGNMAANAANQAAQMQQSQANQSRIALSPWTGSGQAALGKITDLLGLGELTSRGQNDGRVYVDPTNAQARQTEAFNAFQTTPGYQFRMDEGSRALDRSAASRGLLRSGAQQKALTAFGQGIASEEYGNYMNNLMSLSGSGGQAAASGNNTAAQLTGNAGNMIAQGGLARGSGYAAGANALASGISRGGQNIFSALSVGGSGGKLGLPGWS